MLLPGRLKSTTLGDLLGTVHRAAASGVLELVEDRGRTHRVHIAAGHVTAVEVDGAGASLAEILRRERAADDDVLRRSLLRAMASQRLHGEVLVDEFHISPAIVHGALRRQLATRLAWLEALADARISFRVAVRAPRGSLSERPLEPREFLFGRRRARERAASPPPSPSAADLSAWHVLGLPPGAREADIKRAYRRLARSVHPDLHPEATADERRALEARLVTLNEAYRVLVA
jgi:hypothetical protein